MLAADARAQQMFADYAMLEACLEMVWTSGEGQLTETSETGEPESIAAALPVVIEGVPDLHAPVSPLYTGGSFLFSYAAALVIVGLGLLIGWAYQVSIPRPSTEKPFKSARSRSRRTSAPSPKWFLSAASPTRSNAAGPIPRWERSITGTSLWAASTRLASGLLEITYDTGARSSFKGLACMKWNPPAAIFRSVG